MGYVNEQCGQLSISGVYKQTEGTDFLAIHLTEFSYFEAMEDSQWHPERLYASPIIWVIILSHIYLLLTLAAGLLCCKKKGIPDTTIFAT